MAEFCSKCTKEHGFGTDIDIRVEFDNLKEGYEVSILCEGCAMIAIGKTFTGKCIVLFGQLCPNPNLRGKWWYYDVDTNIVESEYVVLDNKPEN